MLKKKLAIIKVVRELSREGLAKHLGVSVDTLINWGSRGGEPCPENVKKIDEEFKRCLEILGKETNP